MERLDGRVALVTGARGGIGVTIARGLDGASVRPLAGTSRG
jgi:NAD(P)-dependent dehydrogenase (short-subunit alcohol dehydrogenase family)